MIRTRRSGTTFYCFSPPVMIATFVIEIALAFYVLLRYLDSPVKRLSVAMLSFLALFQLAEYNVCGGLGINSTEWSRIGFVAITMLPALGIHLAQALKGVRLNRITLAAYGTAAMWAGLFAFSNRAFNNHVCAGNYVIFHLQNHVGGLYLLYYYAWLFISIGMCLRYARTTKKRVREALHLQAIGYLVFLVPTTVANTVNTQTIEGLPSVMCGFAVIFAFVLTFGIVPITVKSRSLRSGLTRLRG